MTTIKYMFALLRQRRAEPESNQCPSVYQPNARPNQLTVATSVQV